MAGATPQVQSGAWVDKSTSLDPSCTVGQGARLFGHVTVGERVRIEPNVVVYGPARICPGSFVGPSVVLGFPSRTDLAACLSQGQGIHDVPGRRQLVIGRSCIIGPAMSGDSCGT